MIELPRVCRWARAAETLGAAEVLPWQQQLLRMSCPTSNACRSLERNTEDRRMPRAVLGLFQGIDGPSVQQMDTLFGARPRWRTTTIVGREG